MTSIADTQAPERKAAGEIAADQLPFRPNALHHAALALAYVLQPKRIAGVPGLCRLWLKRKLQPAAGFPLLAPVRALRQPDGLIDVGPKLTPERVLDAYAQGIFPHCHLPPMKWWAPAKRAVLHLNESRVDKNVRRAMRKGSYKITFDTAFGAVVQACAAPRQGRYALTWISPEIGRVYGALHRQGHAHSVEAWDEQGTLVGGLYGLAVGPVFFTESMFAAARDASKVCFVTLNRHLAEWGFLLNDGKSLTGHLQSLGMREIDHADFVAAIQQEFDCRAPAGTWALDDTLDVTNWQPGASAT